MTFAVFAALGATACQSVSNSLTPDVVYYNGKIATVNAKFEMVQAVAVSGDRIVALGSNEDMQALASEDTRLTCPRLLVHFLC